MVRTDPVDGRLLVDVSNGPAAHPVLHEGVDDGGGRAHLGLVGIAERVSLLGGSCRHGATDDGGFRLLAVLPLRGSAAPTSGPGP